jgi:hypothetical protein
MLPGQPMVMSPMSPHGAPLPQAPGTPSTHAGALLPSGPPPSGAPHVAHGSQAGVTPSTPGAPPVSLPRMNSVAPAFIPGGGSTGRKGLVIRDADGRPVDVSALAKQSNGSSVPSPVVTTPVCDPCRSSIRIDSEAAKLEQEKREEKEKKEREEKRKAKKAAAKKAKEEAECKAKEEAERKVKEEAKRKAKDEP